MKIKQPLRAGEINEGLGQFVCNVWQGEKLMLTITTDSHKQTEELAKMIVAIPSMVSAINDYKELKEYKESNINQIHSLMAKSEKSMSEAWNKIK